MRSANAVFSFFINSLFKILSVLSIFCITIVFFDLICAGLLKLGYTLDSVQNILGKPPPILKQPTANNYLSTAQPPRKYYGKRDNDNYIRIYRHGETLQRFQTTINGFNVYLNPRNGNSTFKFFAPESTGLPPFERNAQYDKNGRRDFNHSQSEFNSSIMTIGCSFTFGVGVQDNETIQYSIEKNLKNVKVYNGGIPGGGPQDFWLHAKYGNFFDDLYPKKGTLIYLHFPGHIERLLPRANWLKFNKSNNHMLYEASDGSIDYRGYFHIVNPIRFFLLETYFNSNVYAFSNIEMPPLTQNDYEFIARIVANIRDLYLEKTLPTNKFIVAFHSLGQDDRFAMALAPFGIKILDYSRHNISHYLAGPSTIIHEGHFSPEFNEVFGEMIANDLKSNRLLSD